MSAPGIAVIVVAYNSSETIADCVDSCREDGRVHEIVVVDNFRDQVTAEIVGGISDRDQRVRYLEPGGNLGFACGCNLGVDETSAPWLAFVNPDVRMTSHLSRIVDNVESLTLSAGSARLVSNERSAINARPRVTLYREFRKAIFGSRSYRFHLDPDRRTTLVDQVDGALLVVKRDTFERIGRFDSQFELYYEDVDLCDRLRDCAPIGLMSEPAGVHIGGHSFRGASESAYVALRVSRIRYLRKRYRSGTSFGVVLVTLVLLEYLVRSLTRQAETDRTRWRSLRAQVAEIWNPRSITALRQ